MDYHKAILCTGGTGLLGQEMHKHRPFAFYPTSTELDVTVYPAFDNYRCHVMKFHHAEFHVVLHAAALTSPPTCDKSPMEALQTNILGTLNAVRFCAEHNLRLVYISTDYVFRGDKGQYKEDDALFPVNKYAWSKLGGECAVRMYDNSLIIRTSFGPDLFPYPKAFTDQWTSREPVSVIAAKIASLLDTDLTGVIHVGADRRTVYEYARSIDHTSDLSPVSREDMPFILPRDTSLDCSR